MYMAKTCAYTWPINGIGSEGFGDISESARCYSCHRLRNAARRNMHT